MEGKRFYKGPAVLIFIMLFSITTQAAIVPITGVDAGTNGSPPYQLLSVTVDGMTITRSRLVTGTTDGDALGNFPIEDADSFDLNKFAGRTGRTDPEFKTTQFGGQTLYSDTNGSAPDFFIFELGMTDDFTIQAILPDGSLGPAVFVTAAGSYGPTGLFSVAGGGAFDGQEIGGLAFDITDLMISRDTPIRGLKFSDSAMDPCLIAAVVPEPATLMLMAGGAFILQVLGSRKK